MNEVVKENVSLAISIQFPKAIFNKNKFCFTIVFLFFLFCAELTEILLKPVCCAVWYFEVRYWMKMAEHPFSQNAKRKSRNQLIKIVSLAN